MKKQRFINRPTTRLMALSIACLTANIGLVNASFANDEVMADGDDLSQCATVSDNIVRLACYDQAVNGHVPDMFTQKRPVDLSSTIKSTVKGNPQVIFSDSTIPTDKTESTKSDVAQTASSAVKLDKPEQKTTQVNKTAPTKHQSSSQQEQNAKWYDDNLQASESADAIVQKKSLKDKVKGIFGKDDQYKDNIATSTQGNVLTELGVPKEALAKYSPLSLAFDLDKNSERGLWTARPHNANYILPIYYNGRPNYNPTTPTLGTQIFTDNELRDIELKFQLSLKTKAAQNLFGTDADLWIGYTQLSHWQTYNEDHSRPFRAHDYEPEIFLTQPVAAELPLNGRLRMLGVGAVHHSNGESDPLSRSWNRAYVMAGAEWGRLTVMPRVWAISKNREGSKQSDNPDISDYYGYGDIKFLYRLDGGKGLSGTARFNPKTNKGALQLDYVHPIGRGVSGYVQIFQGYGQSLIDYNHEATSVGVGVMLNDWLGL